MQMRDNQEIFFSHLLYELSFVFFLQFTVKPDKKKNSIDPFQHLSEWKELINALIDF